MTLAADDVPLNSKTRGSFGKVRLAIVSSGERLFVFEIALVEMLRQGRCASPLSGRSAATHLDPFLRQASRAGVCDPLR